jgi:hypothetical protein
MEVKMSRNIDKPSNKKFGIFFSIVFFLFSLYLFHINNFFWSYLVLCISLFFIFLAYFFSDSLKILNRAWFKFGLALSLIINPIIMGIIYFLIFTPIALISRLIGRDELTLNKNDKTSNWKIREHEYEPSSFKKQF